MSSRDKILGAVKANKPESTALPSMKLFDNQLTSDLSVKFGEMLSKIGGKTIVVDTDNNLENIILEHISSHANINKVASTLDEIFTFVNADLNTVVDAHDLHDIDMAILKGQFGVAENGCVWLYGKNLIHNAIPFITQHLILVISKSSIYENMHVAYQHIDVTHSKYGVFIAGPSKTADIEQSLVIGAHGSRSLLVIIT